MQFICDSDCWLRTAKYLTSSQLVFGGKLSRGYTNQWYHVYIRSRYQLLYSEVYVCSMCRANVIINL